MVIGKVVIVYSKTENLGNIEHRESKKDERKKNSPTTRSHNPCLGTENEGKLAWRIAFFSSQLESRVWQFTGGSKLSSGRTNA